VGLTSFRVSHSLISSEGLCLNGEQYISACSPNRAETVMAHHWMVMSDFILGTPWTYLPHAGRLYCRQKPLPVGESLGTKTTLAEELLREADAESAARCGGPVMERTRWLPSLIPVCIPFRDNGGLRS
jgi:hypothetical protein